MTSAALRRRLYVLAFVDEFVPFAVVFTLWFADNGITVAQFSLVFVVWAGRALVLEVPSGMVADRVDRRRLIAVAFLLRGIGIAVWLVVPDAHRAPHRRIAVGDPRGRGERRVGGVDPRRTRGGRRRRRLRRGHRSRRPIRQRRDCGRRPRVSTPLLGLGIGLEALGWITCGDARDQHRARPVASRRGWVVARSRDAEQADDQAPVALSSGEPLRIVLRNRAVAIPDHRRCRCTPGDSFSTTTSRCSLVIEDSTTRCPARVPRRLGRTADRRRDRRQAPDDRVEEPGRARRGRRRGRAGGVDDRPGLDPAADRCGIRRDRGHVGRVGCTTAGQGAHSHPSDGGERSRTLAAFVIGLALLAIGSMSDGDDPTPGMVVVAVALIATAPVVARLPALRTTA